MIPLSLRTTRYVWLNRQSSSLHLCFIFSVFISCFSAFCESFDLPHWPFFYRFAASRILSHGVLMWAHAPIVLFSSDEPGSSRFERFLILSFEFVFCLSLKFNLSTDSLNATLSAPQRSFHTSPESKKMVRWIVKSFSLSYATQSQKQAHRMKADPRYIAAQRQQKYSDLPRCDNIDLFLFKRNPRTGQKGWGCCWWRRPSCSFDGEFSWRIYSSFMNFN